MQAEAINVAAELGKLSLTLRSLDSARIVAAAAALGDRAETPVKATWAGDVSPALGSVSPPGKLVTAEQPPVLVFHGANRENIKQ